MDPITKDQIYLNGPVRPTETEAAKGIASLLRRAESGNHPDRSATVAYLFERWLAVVDLEESTREANEGYIRRVFAPTVGDMPLRKLQDRVDILDRLYAHLRECSQLCGGKPGLMDHRTTRPHECAPVRADGTPKSTPRPCQPHVCKGMLASTVWRINAILPAACNYAIAWGWIDRNPAALVHKPKLKKKRARPQSAEQVAALINRAFETDFEFGIYLWACSHDRRTPGELCGLLWKHVDLEHGLMVLEENEPFRATL